MGKIVVYIKFSFHDMIRFAVSQLNEVGQFNDAVLPCSINLYTVVGESELNKKMSFFCS